jgi:protein NrfD
VIPMVPDLVVLPAFVEFHWLHADHWGLSIPVYLYLAAVAGGAYLTGASASLLRWRGDTSNPLQGAIARWGFVVAVVAAAGAGLAVLSHLAVIYRAVLFPIYLTNFGSWITIGTWILVSLAAFSVIGLVLVQFGGRAAADAGPSLFPRWLAGRLGLQGALDGLADRVRSVRPVFVVLHLLGAVLAVGTLYTGFELAIVEAVPLWNRPSLMPGLFLASGIAAGMGVTVALTMAVHRKLTPVLGGYAVVVALLSGVSLLLVWQGWSSLAANGTPAAAASYAQLTGDLAIGVWLVALGFVAPLAAGLVLGTAAVMDRLSRSVERLGGPTLIASFVLLAVGSFALRVLLLLAAAKDPVVVVSP